MMARPGTISSQSEREPRLQTWLKEIETTWQQISEFEVPQGKLQHLAVICDGNRRAAQEKNLNPYSAIRRLRKFQPHN